MQLSGDTLSEERRRCRRRCQQRTSIKLPARLPVGMPFSSRLQLLDRAQYSPVRPVQLSAAH